MIRPQKALSRRPPTRLLTATDKATDEATDEAPTRPPTRLHLELDEAYRPDEAHCAPTRPVATDEATNEATDEATNTRLPRLPTRLPTRPHRRGHAATTDEAASAGGGHRGQGYRRGVSEATDEATARPYFKITQTLF